MVRKGPYGQGSFAVRFYDATRHTFATSLLNGSWGTPLRIEDVSALLGHRDIAMT